MKKIVLTLIGLMFSGMIQAASYGPVDAKETLWSIASKTRPSYDVSTQQMMLAIQRHNPEAFSSSNINSLRAGAVLELPTLAEIQKVGAISAIRTAKSQNSQWQQQASNTTSTKKSSSSKQRQTAASQRHYKASQRELKKVQRELRSEKRKVRKLQTELTDLKQAVEESPSGSVGSVASLAMKEDIKNLQKEVAELKGTIKAKDIHIAELTMIKKAASHNIKNLQADNETLVSKLNALDPNALIGHTSPAKNFQLELTGNDNTTGTINPDALFVDQQTQSTSTATSNEGAAIQSQNNQAGEYFKVALAALALLIVLALIWKTFLQNQNKNKPKRIEPHHKDDDLLEDKASYYKNDPPVHVP